MTAPQQETRKPGPNLWLSLGIFLAGAVLASVGVIMLGGSLLGAITEDAFEIPGGETRDFEAGTFDVYVSSSDFFFPTETLDADFEDITITNVDTGENVDVARLNSNTTVGRGQTNFVPIANFEVVEPGSYQIAVLSDVGGLAFVSAALPNSFAEVQTQVIMMGGGFLLVLLGAVMIIIGAVRRSRAKKNAKPAFQGHPAPVPGQFQQYPPPTTQTPQVPHAPTTPQVPQAPTTPQAPAPPPAQPPSSGSADSATPWDS